MAAYVLARFLVFPLSVPVLDTFTIGHALGD